jgi:stage III sporulation protein AC
MSVGILFKIAAVGLLVSILCQLLKNSGRDDLGHLVSLAGLLVVLFWILPYVLDLFETMQSLFEL